MTRRIICLLIAAASGIGVLPLFAQEGATAAAGTLTLDKKTYTLKRALAYETTIDDEDAIAVVLSGQPVTSEMLKEAREAEKEGGDPGFKRPFLRLVFKKTGEFKYWSAAAGGTMLGRRSGEATGELTAQDGRVKGKAGRPTESEGMFPSGFDARFDVALLKASRVAPGIDREEGWTRRKCEANSEWRLPRQRQRGEAGLRVGAMARAVQRQAGDHAGVHRKGSFQGEEARHRRDVRQVRQRADYLPRRRWRNLWLPGRSQRSPKAGLQLDRQH